MNTKICAKQQHIIINNTKPLLCMKFELNSDHGPRTLETHLFCQKTWY